MEDNIEEILTDGPAVEETPQAEAPETPVEETPKEEPTVPLAALHSVRDDNKELKRQLDHLTASLQPKPEPEVVPDVFDNPEAYTAHVDKRLENFQTQFQHERLVDKLNLSESYAVKQHGDQSVEEAKAWFTSQDQSFQDEVRAQVDPYDYLIQKHKQSSLTEKLNADPEKMKQVMALLNGEQIEQKSAPQTTVGSRSMGARTGPEWTGPTSLNDLLDS